MNDGQKIKPSLPNAQHYIQRGECYDAPHPDEEVRQHVKENLLPLRGHNLLELIGNKEIVPRIKAIVAKAIQEGLYFKTQINL